MKTKEYIYLTLAVAVGAFVALIAWTLIVKNQVSQTITTAAATNPVTALLTSL